MNSTLRISPRSLVLTLSLVAWLQAAATVRADIVVSPNFPVYGGASSLFFRAWGENFVARASESSVQTVSFMWATGFNDASTDPTITANLRSGKGFGGTVLATKTLPPIPDRTPNFSWVDFTFDSPVALTAGSTYTLHFTVNGFDDYSGGYIVAGQFYPSGDLLTGGSATPTLTDDMAFRVLSVPEPSSFALLAIGSILLHRRRRR
jgi:hypothetical protein